MILFQFVGTFSCFILLNMKPIDSLKDEPATTNNSVFNISGYCDRLRLSRLIAFRISSSEYCGVCFPFLSWIHNSNNLLMFDSIFFNSVSTDL